MSMKSSTDLTKKRKPKTVVFNHTDEFISFYEIWIWPYSKMNFGARVLFFRANKEEKVICHVYLEEPFVPDTNDDMLGGKQERQFVDNICDIALKALVKKGLQIKEDFNVHIADGRLAYE